jgi:hypothetical protein
MHSASACVLSVSACHELRADHALWLFEPFEHFFWQQVLCLASHQAWQELRQHIEVKTRIRQLEAERVFSIDAGAYGIGRLAITQMLQKLGDRTPVGRIMSVACSAASIANRQCVRMA